MTITTDEAYARSLLQRRHGNLASHREYDDALDRLLKRIEQLQQERDAARENAKLWRGRAWMSNRATNPFPWEQP